MERGKQSDGWDGRDTINRLRSAMGKLTRFPLITEHPQFSLRWCPVVRQRPAQFVNACRR